MKKLCVGFVLSVFFMHGCIVSPSFPAASPGSGNYRSVQTESVSLIPPGTVVPLSKAMNGSFIHDYENGDIIVEATFLKTGNGGQVFPYYDTAAHTVFQVLEPGGAATAHPFGGEPFGTFAGLPKGQSDILFTLKHGDSIQLRGAPIGYFVSGAGFVEAIFDATSVTLIETGTTTAVGTASAASGEQSPADKFQELNDLKARGVLTDEEYEAQKKTLFDQMQGAEQK